VTTTIFDPAAAAYDRWRPAYPSGLYDAIERLSGIPLAGALLVEVGAGTGIATRELRRRGAWVVALDLSLAMLSIQDPAAMRVVARGERLPVRAGVADLVCAATSWHWIESMAGLAEAVRALRPGGALALWWNRLYQDAPWYQAREDALRRRGITWAGCYAGGFGETGLDADLRAQGWFASVDRHDIEWARTVPIPGHLAELATHSSVLRLGQEAGDYIAEQRAVLAREFPDGLVQERYLCHLHVAKTPT
jgi:SAM-dependent methyltransferase